MLNNLIGYLAGTSSHSLLKLGDSRIVSIRNLRNICNSYYCETFIFQ